MCLMLCPCCFSCLFCCSLYSCVLHSANTVLAGPLHTANSQSLHGQRVSRSPKFSSSRGCLGMPLPLLLSDWCLPLLALLPPLSLPALQWFACPGTPCSGLAWTLYTLLMSFDCHCLPGAQTCLSRLNSLTCAVPPGGPLCSLRVCMC